jgi:hypothetical protein
MRREVLTPDVTAEAGPVEETVEFGPRRRRTRNLLIAAVAAAVVVNAGALWSYWHIAGPGAGAAHGNRVVMELRGRSNLAIPLKPGARGDLVVTVTNVNAFPIRITEITPGNGIVVAEGKDDECRESGIGFAHTSVRVDWPVPRNTVGAFTLPDAIAMSPHADKACTGAAYFTVPIRASGEVA